MICVRELASRNYGKNAEYAAKGANNFLRGSFIKIEKLVKNVEPNISALSHQFIIPPDFTNMKNIILLKSEKTTLSKWVVYLLLENMFS